MELQEGKWYKAVKHTDGTDVFGLFVVEYIKKTNGDNVRIRINMSYTYRYLTVGEVYHEAHLLRDFVPYSNNDSEEEII